MDRDVKGRWLPATPEEQRAQNRRFVAALRKGMRPVEAARLAGRSIGTMRFRRKDIAFARAWDEAYADALALRGNRRVIGHGGFTLKRERHFLRELAAHGNVGWAATRAGVDCGTVYRRRHSHPGFRDAFAAAVGSGRARLDAEVSAAALRAFAPEDDEASAVLARMTIAEALAVWRTQQMQQRPHAREDRDAEPSIEELRKTIRARIAALRDG